MLHGAPTISGYINDNLAREFAGAADLLVVDHPHGLPARKRVVAVTSAWLRVSLRGSSNVVRVAGAAREARDEARERIATRGTYTGALEGVPLEKPKSPRGGCRSYAAIGGDAGT